MHARLPILTGPTPLEHLPNLSAHLGIDLHIKRDDLAGPPLGGNKSRQLAYYFGDALAQNADTILITGAVQSNFVRLAVSVARAQGMEAIIQLEERLPGKSKAYRSSGNVLLSSLMGARILHYPYGEDEAGADQALEAEAETLRQHGRRPYVIHLSEGHPPLGALGYVDAAEEILAEGPEFDAFVVASGSGATHTGLLAGLRGAGSEALVFGSCVRRNADLQRPRLERILGRLAALYPPAGKVALQDISLFDEALAPGYGQIGPKAAEAIRLMAELEGILLDPVYTAKSFAAVPALVASGDIRKGARVCFIHTGGLAATFAYADELSSTPSA